MSSLHGQFHALWQEMFSYVCPDMAKEFAKYDSEPDKWIKKYNGVEAKTKKVCMCRLVSTHILSHPTLACLLCVLRLGAVVASVPLVLQPWVCDVGYERFLAPEIFFAPEIYSSDYTTPLPKLVDDTVQMCPIDTRRGLYNVRVNLFRFS